MRVSLINGERGAGLVEYALVALFIAVVSMVAVTAIGEETSQSFDTIAGGFAAAEPEAELTPDEKWELAKQEYADAIDEAKAKKAEDIASAKAEYQSQVQENKDLPKSERKAANAEAKSEFNQAKSDANNDYKSSVQSAKEARDAAKDEWKATR